MTAFTLQVSLKVWPWKAFDKLKCPQNLILKVKIALIVSSVTWCIKNILNDHMNDPLIAQLWSKRSLEISWTSVKTKVCIRAGFYVCWQSLQFSARVVLYASPGLPLMAVHGKSSMIMDFSWVHVRTIRYHHELYIFPHILPKCRNCMCCISFHKSSHISWSFVNSCWVLWKSVVVIFLCKLVPFWSLFLDRKCFLGIKPLSIFFDLWK